MTEQQIFELTQLIKEVSTRPNADEHIATILKMASADNADGRKTSAKKGQKTEKEKKSGILKFTKKEISQMSAAMRNYFKYNNVYVKYRYIRGMFQARYRRDGKRIEVASMDFEMMKERFIEKFNEAYSTDPKYAEKLPLPAAQTVTFAVCAENWLKIKERTTKPSTYKEYVRSYNVNLKPTFGDCKIGEITRPMIQDYLFSFVDEGHHRTAEKLKLQLNCIFDMAVEDYKIDSPMKKIVIPSAKPKRAELSPKQKNGSLSTSAYKSRTTPQVRQCLCFCTSG